MNFIAEMYEKLHKADDESYLYAIQIFENSGVLIEGHKGMVSLSDKEIKIRLTRGAVTVSGEKLCITYVSKTELCISGDIAGVAYS